MTEDHGIFDKFIIPDNTVKISVTDEILALWLAHGGPNDAGFPKVYVDNDPRHYRYRVKHPNLKEAVELLKQSIVLDGWMADCWDHHFYDVSSSHMITDINRSIQYIQDLMAAYGRYETLLLMYRSGVNQLP